MILQWVSQWRLVPETEKISLEYGWIGIISCLKEL